MKLLKVDNAIINIDYISSAYIARESNGMSYTDNYGIQLVLNNGSTYTYKEGLSKSEADTELDLLSERLYKGV